jgi:putative ABC transport system ATP-binding protein
VLEDLASKGKTVILVTHEPDIAAYTRRVITLRDGQVVSDAPTAAQKSARQELDRLGKEVAS